MYAIEDSAYKNSPQFVHNDLIVDGGHITTEIITSTTIPLSISQHRQSNKEERALQLDMDETQRTAVLSKMLSPVLNILALFGLFYKKEKGFPALCKVSQAYTCLVNIMLIGYLGTSCYAITLSNNIDEYLMVSAMILFKLRAAIQGCIMIRLCQTGSLWEFIKNLEEYLLQISAAGCNKSEWNFVRKIRIWSLTLAALIVLFLSCFLFMSIYKGSPAIERLNAAVSLPFSNTPENRYKRIVPDMLLFGAWFLPTVLCVVLIQCLEYTFKEFYRHINMEKDTSGLCCKKYVQTLRQNFIKLTDLCNNFDNMVNVLIMVCYLIDIISICLLYRMILVTHLDLTSRLLLLAFVMLPTVSLVVLSMNASRLYDTGQEMRGFAQLLMVSGVGNDAKVELDLFLFHLSNEPVVITVWKMIPLTRSIIVSICVSIITYLAMLLSFQ